MGETPASRLRRSVLDKFAPPAHIPFVPRIIEYPDVVAETERLGLRSLYPNSGAFGFPPTVAARHVGWIGGEDSSLRPAARELAILVPPPTERTLAQLAAQAWTQLLSADLWLMPKAHWAYELDFGSAAWMPDLLRRAGVNPDHLVHRHDGTALSFSSAESEIFVPIAEGLLTNLLGSDFQFMFQGRAVVCTLHHHKQLWWSSPDEDLIEKLRALPPSSP